VFQDGFADISNWTFDSGLAGNVAPVYSTAQNQGGIAGDGSFFFQAGSPHWVYHDLASSLSSGGYKTGTLSGWIYDVNGAVGGLRTALRAYLYDSSGTYQTIYWIGVTNGNPPNLSTHYIGAVFTGAWTYYDLGVRSTDWHKLGIEILPYTGSNDLKFYIDGLPVYTASQPPAAANACVRRIYLGYNYNVNQDAYYDDITYETVPPAAPTGLVGTPLSTTSIRWGFTDNANNEVGDRLYDGATQLIQSETINANYIDETGLAPNTSYTRSVKAYAGVYESAGATGTGYTLSVPPSTSNVTCDKATGVWQSGSAFTFTAVGGFGPGLVDHYRVVWDQQATHTWTGTEAVWSAGDLVMNATASASGWYLHVKGYNLSNQENGTVDLGPYFYDGSAPEIGEIYLTPPMIAVGDPLHVSVVVVDDVGVTSVTANDVPLAQSGNVWTWVGDLVGAEPTGIKHVTIVAQDASGKSVTDAYHSYKIARIMAMSTSAAWLPAVNSFYGTHLFKFWGRVTEINEEHFSLDDGSGVPITVLAPGYKTKLQTGDMATVRGVLRSTGSFETTPDFIIKFP